MIKKFEEFVKLNESNFNEDDFKKSIELELDKYGKKDHKWRNAVLSNKNDDWEKTLDLFLKQKYNSSKGSDVSDVKWGSKNHNWKHSVLPTKDKTNTQTLNCFLDFSGSSSKSTTFNFLGVLVGLCVENEYSKINVYGFGEKLSKPFVIDLQNEDVKSRYLDLIISKLFTFIESQNVGSGTENFEEVVEEINILKQKNKDSVFLIFGDGIWQDLDSFKNDCSALKDMCVVVCDSEKNSNTKQFSKIKLELNHCGFKSIIYVDRNNIDY
jgi:hypothetical protein